MIFFRRDWHSPYYVEVYYSLDAGGLGLIHTHSSDGNATTVTIEATADIPHWLDLGSFNPASNYVFSVIDPATLWSAGSDVPFPRTSTADGIPLSVGYGKQTTDGFTFQFGELVGFNNGFYSP